MEPDLGALGGAGRGGAAAGPGARGTVPGAAAGPPKARGECGTCKKKRCRSGDGCFCDAASRTCQDVGTDLCRGIQKKHGKKAPPPDFVLVDVLE